MVRLYVEAINTPDAIPNVQRAWDTFVSAKCADVKQAALQTYDALMTSQLCDVLPCSNTEIRSSHGAALEACEAPFMIELAGICLVQVMRIKLFNLGKLSLFFIAEIVKRSLDLKLLAKFHE